MKRPRDQGLICKLLDVVFTAITLSRIKYASQAWSGHVSAASIDLIDALLRCMRRYDFSQSTLDFCDSNVARNFAQFYQTLETNHFLHRLLPREKRN
jgi:hypothetical protein